MSPRIRFTNSFLAHGISTHMHVTLKNKFTFFFCYSDGSRWSSGHFWHTHLYHFVMGPAGDPLSNAVGDGLGEIFIFFVITGEEDVPMSLTSTKDA
jgi:hypothetical protein